MCLEFRFFGVNKSFLGSVSHKVNDGFLTGVTETKSRFSYCWLVRLFLFVFYSPFCCKAILCVKCRAMHCFTVLCQNPAASNGDFIIGGSFSPKVFNHRLGTNTQIIITRRKWKDLLKLRPVNFHLLQMRLDWLFTFKSFLCVSVHNLNVFEIQKYVFLIAVDTLPQSS